MSSNDIPESRYSQFETESDKIYTKNIGEYTVTLSGYVDEFRDVLQITDQTDEVKQKISGDRDMIREKFISIESVADVKKHIPS